MQGWEGIPRGSNQSTTTGWRPTCDCVQINNHLHKGEQVQIALEPVPCIVMDIFGGAGTVGLVADRLGRDSIMIELNPDYAEMTRKRIEDDAGWVADVTVDEPLVQQMELL